MERTLTDEEVRALKTILVKGNKEVVGVAYTSGYQFRGVGGSHDPVTESEYILTLEEMDGKPPYQAFGKYLRAVVDDVVYLTNTLYNDAVVTVVTPGNSDYDVYGGAYDTIFFCYIGAAKR